MKYLFFFIGCGLLLFLSVRGMKRDYENKDRIGSLLIDSEIDHIRTLSILAHYSKDTVLKKHTDSTILALLPDVYELRGTIRAKSNFLTPYTKSNASVDTLIQKIIYYGNKK